MNFLCAPKTDGTYGKMFVLMDHHSVKMLMVLVSVRSFTGIGVMPRISTRPNTATLPMNSRRRGHPLAGVAGAGAGSATTLFFGVLSGVVFSSTLSSGGGVNLDSGSPIFE